MGESKFDGAVILRVAKELARQEGKTWEEVAKSPDTHCLYTDRAESLLRSMTPTPLKMAAKAAESEFVNQGASVINGYDFTRIAKAAVDAYLSASGEKYTYAEVDEAVKNASVLADVRNYIRGLGK